MTTTTSSSSSSTTAAHSRKFIRYDDEEAESYNKLQQEVVDEEEQQQQQQTTTKDKLIETIQESIIGDSELFKSPFGFRKVTYCDYVASGRSLKFIEDYIQNQVLTLYANTHTTTSVTGHQSTLFRYESRGLLMNAMNGSKKDVLIWTGSGATSASNKLIHLLNIQSSSQWSEDEQPVVLVGPYEHHSNLLPWRESSALIVQINEDAVTGHIDQQHLKEQLIKYSNNKRLIIGAFSAASNVTGLLTDTDTITALLHMYGAYAVWDYACAAPYVKIDMNVSKKIYGQSCRKDAIFFSPHKFVGGVSTPGVLLVKKHMFRNVQVPTQPGGDTVFFVTDQDHRYLEKPHEREEAGTPDVVGSVRCGLVFQLKSAVGEENIEQIEQRLYERVVANLSKNSNIMLLGYDESQTVKKLPIFSFLIRFNKNYVLHYNYVCTLLNDLFGIQSRGGCACAGPYALRLLGIHHELAKKIEDALVEDDDHEFLRPGFTRVNFNYFFNEATIEYVLEAINFVADHGWKLLPYYTFYPETGEWKHVLNKRTAHNRRWIHNISYNSGTMSYRHQVNQHIPLKDYKKLYDKYLKEANEIVEDALREYGANAYFMDINSTDNKREKPNILSSAGQIPDQRQMLKSHVEQLRWFVYPIEVLNYLKDGPGKESEIFAQPCPFRPITYKGTHISDSFKDNTISTEAVTVEEQEDTVLSGTDNVNTKKEDTPSQQPVAQSIQQEEEEMNAMLGFGSDDEEEEVSEKIKLANLWPKIPVKKIVAPVKRAVMEFGMIKDGDRILLGLSGGKDSLTLLHVLKTLQKSNLQINFEFGCCTVDPQTDAYDPSPLKNYCKMLGVPYFFESQNIIESAMTCQASSICSWCSRMKRGILYNTARREGYNVLALGQHLDDCAESFIMSALHNGYLRTQKAHYLIDEGDLRVIRPMIYVREKDLKLFARDHLLPIINENCPACFEMPKERARVKTLLSNQEHLFPDLYHSLESAMRPLMDSTMDSVIGADQKKFKSSGKNKWTADRGETKPDDKTQQQQQQQPILASSYLGSKKARRKARAQQRWDVTTKQLVPKNATPTTPTTTDDIQIDPVAQFLASVDTSVLEQEIARRKQQIL
jgi:selenocysteine lyase/cysteine desulfurase/tRNA(Ile)-lysidine synthase TilS/MesJ